MKKPLKNRRKGYRKNDENRLRTTVSLRPWVWELATEIGGCRGAGLEKMAEFWLKEKRRITSSISCTEGTMPDFLLVSGGHKYPPCETKSHFCKIFLAKT